MIVVLLYMDLFCKQKTAYEMRISDWSSDVCSSDLAALELVLDVVHLAAEQEHDGGGLDEDLHALVLDHVLQLALLLGVLDHVAHAGAALGADADPEAEHRPLAPGDEILHAAQSGRASCRERGCQYVLIPGVAG